MTEPEILEALERAEVALDTGRDLSGTGFWKAVAAVKRDPELVERHADRIAAIDRRAFEAWAALTTTVPFGTTVVAGAMAAGVASLGYSAKARPPWNWLLFGFGTGALLATTHGIGHLVVGRTFGMRFTHWFLAPGRPQPGVKVDYASYLRTPPKQRAWMHASGALITKVVPFALLPLARRMPRWVFRLMVGVGIVQIVTDIAWSTRASDWKKFRREIRYAP